MKISQELRAIVDVSEPYETFKRIVSADNQDGRVAPVLALWLDFLEKRFSQKQGVKNYTGHEAGVKVIFDNYIRKQLNGHLSIEHGVCLEGGLRITISGGKSYGHLALVHYRQIWDEQGDEDSND